MTKELATPLCHSFVIRHSSLVIQIVATCALPPCSSNEYVLGNASTERGGYNKREAATTQVCRVATCALPPCSSNEYVLGNASTERGGYNKREAATTQVCRVATCALPP